jgi:hypothetical protein
MDYPNVTLVLQLGMPSAREQYIHRLGRTARAGAGGQGLLVLSPFEEFFLRKIKDLPIQPLTGPLAQRPSAEHIRLVMDASARVPTRIRNQAYVAWMGFYNSSLRALGWDKPYLVCVVGCALRASVRTRSNGMHTGATGEHVRAHRADDGRPAAGAAQDRGHDGSQGRPRPQHCLASARR